MTTFNTQLFNEIGKLNVMHTEAELLLEQYHLKLAKCGKQAKIVEKMTDQYICEYGTYPQFID